MTTRAALAFVRKHGVVLMAARGTVPSLAEKIAGGPFRGSWWGHPRGRRMFRIFEAVADSKDVLVCRLVDGKITFVHRRVWPALVRLEKRLPRRGLAAVRQEHTESGRHRNVVTPFPDWVPAAARRAGKRLDETAAKRLLGAAARLAGLLLLLSGPASLQACGGSGPAPQAASAPAIPATPVDAPDVPYATTYAGDLPCADCAGQRLTLTLFPGGTWRMRRTYRGADAGKDRSLYALGTRAAAPDDRSRLVLHPAAGEPMPFRFVAGDRLQVLDREGREIGGEANFLLSLQASVDPVAGPMPLRGLYTYMADAASFKECSTGTTLPIVPVAGSSALQSAYLAARHAPGQPLLVTLTGQFVDRSPEPGAPVREHLIVTQHQQVGPESRCAPEAAAPGARGARR